MTKTRLSILLALGLLAGACHKSKGPAGPDRGREPTLESTLPANTVMVVGVSAEKIRATKLWERFGPILLEQGHELLEQIKTECKIDPVTDATSLVVATTDMQDEKSFVFVLKGKWTEDSANRCLTVMTEKRLGQKLAIAKEGRYTVFTTEGQQPAYGAWIWTDTFVIGADPQSRGRLEQVLDAGPRLGTNTGFADLLGKTDRKATFWGAVLLPPSTDMAEIERTVGAKPESVYFSLDYTRALSAHIGVRFADASAAKQAADVVSKELEGARQNPMFGDYARAVTASSDGRDAILAVALTEQQVDSLVALVEQQLAPFLQGMGGGALAPSP